MLGDYDWSDEYPSDWPAMKPTTKWGQLPLMQIENGEQMSQTKAMFRFLAKQVVVEGAALYPDDPFEAFKVRVPAMGEPECFVFAFTHALARVWGAFWLR